jgi:hypothetical protein
MSGPPEIVRLGACSKLDLQAINTNDKIFPTDACTSTGAHASRASSVTGHRVKTLFLHNTSCMCVTP